MNKKQYLLTFTLIALLVIIGGCGEEDRYTQFSNEEKALGWSGERTRSFGDADYSTIGSEAEAFDLLQKKYKVIIPTYYEETKKMLIKEIPSKIVHSGEAKYAIFARNKELEFRTIYPFYKGEVLQVFSEVVLTYVYSIDNEQAYLKSQIVTTKISSIKGNLPNDNIKELIEAIGKNMKVPEKQIVSGLTGYEKRVKETEKKITDDYLPIISNTSGLDREKEFFKEIAIVYDEDGTFRELYAEISDQKN